MKVYILRTRTLSRFGEYPRILATYVSNGIDERNLGLLQTKLANLGYELVDRIPDNAPNSKMLEDMVREEVRIDNDMDGKGEEWPDVI